MKLVSYNERIMPEIVLYTKPQCPVCEQAKQLLKEYNQPYTEHVIGQDITREQVIEKFPWVKVAPIIFYNGVSFSIHSLKFMLDKEKKQ